MNPWSAIIIHVLNSEQSIISQKLSFTLETETAHSTSMETDWEIAQIGERAVSLNSQQQQTLLQTWKQQ